MPVITVTGQNVDDVIRQGDATVLLDFRSSQCGPCRMMEPLVEQLARENPALVIGKIGVDTETELAARWDIRSVPAFVTVKQGREVRRLVGVCSPEQLSALVR